MSYVDPAIAGGMPVVGELINVTQADDIVVDLEVLEAALLSEVTRAEAAESSVSAAVTSNTTATTSNATAITNLQTQVTALAAQIAGLGTVIAPVFLADTPPTTGVVGTALTYTFTTSGSPATFTVSYGALPAGLSLSTTGLLSGTPTTAAAYSFVVKATNTAGAPTTGTITMTISTTTVAPVNTGLPVVSGSTVQGAVLTTTNGTWS